MAEEKPKIFLPHTEIWTPGKPEASKDIEVAGKIKEVVSEMNGENPQQIINDLTRHVHMSENGVVSAVLYGNDPREYSGEEAIVMFNPFANMATPNMLVRAEFIRRVAEKMDVRDTNGKLKPVIMLAAPGPGRGLNLTEERRRKIKNGDLGSAAQELLHAVTELNIGKVSLLGFSQGADLALAGAREAYSKNKDYDIDLDVDSLSIGDPAGVHDRTSLGIAGDFLKAGTKALKESVAATGLAVQTKALNMQDMAKFAYAAAFSRTNHLLWRGMTVDSFKSNLEEVLKENRLQAKVVGYGGDSAIAKPEWIEPAIAELYKEYGSESFTSIKVDGANHTWGDNLELLAMLYMRALI